MGQRNIVSYETSMKRKIRIRAASMCRLDVDSSLKEVEQPIDALSSSRYLLGRGVKRKRSTRDDLQDAVADSALPYPQQRQLVLDLCLEKLQTCQRRPEGSLHRSVLLANTLRHLQLEMKLEGSCDDAAVAMMPLPLSPSQAALTPRHTPELPPVPSDIGSPDPDSMSVTSTAMGNSPVPTVTSRVSGVLHAEERGANIPQDSPFGRFEITSSASCYLSDLPLDDIFEDIDTSMYDASDFSALAALMPTQRATAGLATGDEGLKGLPSPLSSSSYPCTPSALQVCLSDLSDLDHIMEILVHS